MKTRNNPIYPDPNQYYDDGSRTIFDLCF